MSDDFNLPFCVDFICPCHPTWQCIFSLKLTPHTGTYYLKELLLNRLCPHVQSKVILKTKTKISNKHRIQYFAQHIMPIQFEGFRSVNFQHYPWRYHKRSNSEYKGRQWGWLNLSFIFSSIRTKLWLKRCFQR